MEEADSDHLEALRNATALLLKKAENATVAEFASAVEQAAGVVRLSADLHTSQAEERKVALEEARLRHEIETAATRERSERVKAVASFVASVVPILALAATVFLQSWQFTRSENDKREAAEDARWGDAVKTISQTSKLSSGVITLNPFLKSAKYHDLARNLAVQLLANSSDETFFNDLFGAALVPAGWNNLGEVIKLDRALTARATPLWIKSYDAQHDTNDYTKLNSAERNAVIYASDALSKISVQVGTILKAPRPSGAPLDLSATGFDNCDWGGADLSGADVSGIHLSWVDLDGAKLDDITSFDEAYFYHIAWWNAKSMSPALREFLANDPIAKYRSGTVYGSKHRTYSPQQYAAALDRLRRQAP